MQTDRANYSHIEQACQAKGLIIYGALHPAQQPVEQLSTGTLILLGTGQGFWPGFTASPEYQDGQRHPIDRWSYRVITALAERFDATAYFPFGAPPYTPFVNWALTSGRAFTSPSQMMVHDTVGLLTSYRGALHLASEIPIDAPPLGQSPCAHCTSKNCINTCPVQAMVDNLPYQVAACKDHLDSPEGHPCRSGGCMARQACPISAGAVRDPAQSAHHMRYFQNP